MKRLLTTLALLAATTAAAQAQDKPNIVIIWGDDIGPFNISAYNMGMMGYRTPNIDSIAAEGALFTDWYGQQSCTAGRAAFVTGQSPIRTGLTKVGLPGTPEGMPKEDPTIATILRAQGYATGQFGKNHLGDRNEHLPTVHGFDEFFGNLYHLNAEEEPEHVNYPADMIMADGRTFKATFGPRGVLDCVATVADTEAPDSRFGAWGNQKCTDSGPLTRKRMETIDEEVTVKALDFMDRTHAAGEPMFLWYNTTRMHIFTHLKAESEGVTGYGIYADGMVEHDGMVGQILQKIEDLGIKDNTIVMYSTDNGAETFSWPDAGTTMFRGEKNTNWEGGYRVPTMIRWPGVIQPGTVINDIGTHEDMFPTLAAAAGATGIKEELLVGKEIGGITYKSHIDGNDLGPALKGEGAWPTDSFIYWTDDGSVAALRYNDWKVTFLEQESHGLRVWQDPFKVLRAPLLTNLRMDPFERAEAENAMGYQRWYNEHMFVFAPAGAYVGRWLQSFNDFPPRQKPGSFNLDNVMQSVMSGSQGNQ